MAGKIKLSERMQMIASHVSPGSRTADIGTDHGYIPVWLISSGVTDKVILTDVNEGPLKKAAASFRRYLPEVKPDLRQGYGLDVVSPGEADDIIIAGMGGILISKILSRGAGVVKTAGTLILQPRNHSFSLRSYLRRLGDFTVVSEEIAVEDKRYCEIITVRRNDLMNSFEREKAEEAGRLEARLGLGERIYDELPVMYAVTGGYDEYINHKCQTEQLVIDNITANGCSEHADRRKLRAEKRLEAFRRIGDAAKRS
ncbi:MAG: class I SAM-dependent methyltransferase [Anaerovoracaceae bacterium]|jgi:tRNA A22 N-methylase